MKENNKRILRIILGITFVFSLSFTWKIILKRVSEENWLYEFQEVGRIMFGEIYVLLSIGFTDVRNVFVKIARRHPKMREIFEILLKICFEIIEAIKWVMAVVSIYIVRDDSSGQIQKQKKNIGKK